MANVFKKRRSTLNNKSTFTVFKWMQMSGGVSPAQPNAKHNITLPGLQSANG